MQLKIASRLSDIAALCLRAARLNAASIGGDVLNLIDPLFDEVWYRDRYPTAVARGEDPRLRYLEDPAARKHSPHPLFDGEWYLEKHPEVAAAGINPLLHYLREGAALGYSPCVAFDPGWYLYTNPDVAAEGMNPLLHFVQFGAREGRLPHPFDEVAAFEAVARSGDPLKAARLLDWRQHLLPQDGTVPYVSMFAWGRISDLLSFEPSASAVPPMPSLGNDKVLGLKNAVVIGGTTAIIVADRFVSADTQAGHANGGPFPCYGDAWRAGETAIVRFKRKSRTYIPHGIHLTGKAEGMFIDFLTFFLPQMLLIESSEIDPTVPLLVSELAGERQMAALQYLNISKRPIISLEKGAAYATDLLYYPVRSNVDVDGTERSLGQRLDGEIAGLVRLRERVRPSVNDAIAGRLRRLYIRPMDSACRLSHHDEFCEALIDRDFEIIAIDTLPFHVLVRLIGGASIVVLHGPDDFAYALWCRPGCHVVNFDDFGQDYSSIKAVRCVISQEVTIHTFRSIFKRSGSDDIPRPYVDLPAVMGALDEVIAAGGQLRTRPVSCTVVATS